MASDDEPDWHDQQPLVMTAGVAALILVAVLVYAVIRTSESSKVPDTVPIPSSSATPSTYTTSSTSTTTYSVPSVQTGSDASKPLDERTEADVNFIGGETIRVDGNPHVE